MAISLLQRPLAFSSSFSKTRGPWQLRKQGEMCASVLSNHLPTLSPTFFIHGGLLVPLQGLCCAHCDTPDVCKTYFSLLLHITGSARLHLNSLRQRTTLPCPRPCFTFLRPDLWCSFLVCVPARIASMPRGHRHCLEPGTL